MSDRPAWIAFGEDRLHFETAFDWGWSICVDEVRWLVGLERDSLIEPLRIKLREVFDLCEKHKVARKHGHFNGEPGASDAIAIANQLRLARELNAQLVFVARDVDDDVDRRVGLRQAIDSERLQAQVVPLVCDPEVEAWHISAWSASTDDERKRHSEVCESLSFDPCIESSRMNSTTGNDRDCKKVVAQLGLELPQMPTAAALTASHVQDIKAFVLAVREAARAIWGRGEHGSA